MDVTDLENPTSRGSPQKFSRRSSSQRSQKSAGQHSSPVLPEKRSKSKLLRQKRADADNKDPHKAKRHEQTTDVLNEKSNFTGYEIYAGKLIIDKKNRSPSHDHGPVNEKADIVDARITSKALIWGSSILQLDEVVSVSYNPRNPHFTVHAYPTKKSFFGKTQRVQKDFQFAASTFKEAILWITCFADQHIYINTLSNPAISSVNQDLDIPISEDLFDQRAIKCKPPPRILVILNPRSGHGRSSKVFHEKAEPIFKLAGFQMEVVKTTQAGHAKSLASSVDFSTCPDGIVCVGGDGIVNEVLNGLLSRSDQKEAVSVPIGIIPAGSDNSLVWTVLGVRDPISASLSIVKGGSTALDVFAVEWIQSGLIHFGSTVSYYGFLSDGEISKAQAWHKHSQWLRYRWRVLSCQGAGTMLFATRTVQAYWPTVHTTFVRAVNLSGLPSFEGHLRLHYF